MKPIIGITPLFDEETNDFWMYKGYMDCVLEAGGIPVVLPLSSDSENIAILCEKCDGFLFTGGPDIDPHLYDIKRYDLHEEPSGMRDRFEKALFEAVIKTDKPILGICRGLQFINVMCGGTLYQDIAAEEYGNLHHRMEKPYNRVQHPVFVYPDTPLYRIVRKEQIGVNSSHHQAICELAPCLDPMALSPDGYIESFYMPGRKFVQGYQWHPEMFPESEYSKVIFRSFIRVSIELVETKEKKAKT